MCSPMVRYSKLAFRLLVRKWGCDLAFTPMIVADGFMRSQKARDSEFRTCAMDKPLVVQFASNDPITFAKCAQKVMNVCSCFDLNCGCPQSWAIQSRIGAYMIRKPQLIKDMLFEGCKLTDYKLPFSIKIRLQSSIRKTIDFLQQILSINDSIGATVHQNMSHLKMNESIDSMMGGLSWISVHGRTLSERTKVKVHLDHIRTIVQHSTIPIIANGDINCKRDIIQCIADTGAQGVMCARGILNNPAIFHNIHMIDELNQCPIECITDYLSFATAYGGTNYFIHHHHMMYMLHSHLTTYERRDFNSRRSMISAMQFLEQKLWL